jgi:hypothetical protein
VVVLGAGWKRDGEKREEGDRQAQDVRLKPVRGKPVETGCRNRRELMCCDGC